MDDSSDVRGDGERHGSRGRSIEERFTIGQHIFATRTADGYQGVENERGQPILFWVLRHPLRVNSEVANRFVERLSVIRDIQAAIPAFFGYGVDGGGNAYLATEAIDGRLLIDTEADIRDLIRLFDDAVRVVSEIHKRGVILGDICEQSFLVDRQMRLALIALSGAFEGDARQTAMLPPTETLHYVSPEQRSGQGGDPASDVYALGVLGYRLLTGRYMFGDKPPVGNTEEQLKLVPAPSAIRTAVPAWMDEIIGKCIEPKIEDRFSDAAELLRALDQAVQTGIVESSGGRWSKRTVMVKPPGAKQAADDTPAAAPTGRSPGAIPKVRGDGSTSGRSLMLVALFLGVGVAIAGGGFFLFDRLVGSWNTIDSEFRVNPEDAPPELRAPLKDFFTNDLPIERRKAALETIAKSDDPFVYPVLEYAVRRTSEPALRVAAQELVVARIKRQGFPHTANLLAKWFQAFASANQNAADAPVYSTLLRACDPSLPAEIRRDSIQKAYAKEPAVSLQLAAALALDEFPEAGPFTDVLRQFLTVRLGRNDLADRSAGALVLSDKSLTVFFDRDVLALLDKFSSADLAYALRQLAEGDSPILKDVAQAVVKRGAIAPFEGVFLKVLVEGDQYDMSPGVRRALVRGSRNELIEEDVVSIGRWTSLEAEPVLLAMCAIAKDEEIRLAAFDTLAVRSLTGEPAASLMDWIKGKLWEKRAKLIQAIGILGHASIAGSDQIEYAFDMLVPFASSGSFLRTMLKTNDNRLIKLALERVAGISSSDDLIPLLSNPDKEIRITTVKALQRRNDLTTLQRIVKAYEKETDEEVRQVYREYHWVVRDRLQ